MFQHVNSFTFSTDDSHNEYLFTFRQQHPTYDQDGNLSGMTAEIVSQIVMNKAGFDALKLLVNEIPTGE